MLSLIQNEEADYDFDDLPLLVLNRSLGPGTKHEPLKLYFDMKVVGPMSSSEASLNGF